MASSINASTSGGGGIITTADATGILQLQSAGTATVTVGTAGGVGIGTTTTTNAKLTVNANTVLPATAPPVGTSLWVVGTEGATGRIVLDSFGTLGGSNLTFRSSSGTAAAPTASLANVLIGNIASFGYGATAYSSSSRSAITFYGAENWTDAAQGTYQVFATTATGTTTNTERMRIDDFGNVTLQKNISVGGATPTTSGSGITFPATQSASSDANTLDDYEEGTWTPTQGAGLTVVGAFSSSGRYTKVGRLVTLTGRVGGATSVATTAGTVMFTNLPFTVLEQATTGTFTNSAINVIGGIGAFTTTAYSATTIGTTPSFDFSFSYNV